jgi:hypothetical protein
VSADKSPVGPGYTAEVVRQSPPTLNALSGFWAGAALALTFGLRPWSTVNGVLRARHHVRYAPTDGAGRVGGDLGTSHRPP